MNYSYTRVIYHDDWSLLEIIPNDVKTKNDDIIKICEEQNEQEQEQEQKQKKARELTDANSNIRKNALKGFK